MSVYVYMLNSYANVRVPSMLRRLVKGDCNFKHKKMWYWLFYYYILYYHYYYLYVCGKIIQIGRKGIFKYRMFIALTIGNVFKKSFQSSIGSVCNRPFAAGTRHRAGVNQDPRYTPQDRCTHIRSVVLHSCAPIDSCYIEVAAHIHSVVLHSCAHT